MLTGIFASKRLNLNENVDYSPRDPEYPGELNYPTNFQNDFVMLSGEAHSVWVANKGLHEYEVCNDKDVSEIAVTLHRAVGKLSVNGGGIRGCHAGPGIDTPGAQCLRQIRHELAFWSHREVRNKYCRRDETGKSVLRIRQLR